MQKIEILVNTLVILSAGLYFFSAIVLFKGQSRTGSFLAGAGWVFNLAIILINWIIAGYPPFANIYHVLTFLSFCFIPLYLIIKLKEKLEWVMPYFILLPIIPLTGVLFMESQISWERAPALQSIWFIPHVLSYVLSYSLAAVAFVLSVISMIKNKVQKNNDILKYCQASYQILRFAFPFMTFGLLSGALWADEAWGVYWSWDIKETWALITWTLYLVYFHSYYNSSLRHWAYVFQLLAFIALLITFLLVNLLPGLNSSHHSYT